MRRVLLLCLFLASMSSQHLLAQDRTVRGRVTNEKGETVNSASVRTKNTKAGTVTGNDGNFTIIANDNTVTGANIRLG